MKNVRVNLKDREYDILVQGGILKDMGALVKKYTGASKCLMVTDSSVYGLYAEKLRDVVQTEGIAASICTIPAGEDNKNINNIMDIYKALAENEVGRGDIILALGGGVIGDMSGYAASTWMRGIRFVQIPTTLLACVDSSVGGKTGINTDFGKNLVGTFSQPSLVLIDSEMLGSLQSREFFSGMAEVVKHALLFDRDMFDYLESNYSREAIEKNIDEMLANNCKLKAHIVEIDEKEKCERMFLNLGHTIAHCVEKSSGYGTYLHGEAVAIGIIFALEYGIKLGITKDKSILERTKSLLTNLNLPIDIPEGLDLMESMKQDKKRAGAKINFVFVESIGVPKIVEVALEDIL